MVSVPPAVSFWLHILCDYSDSYKPTEMPCWAHKELLCLFYSLCNQPCNQNVFAGNTVNHIQNMSYNVNLGHMGKYIDKNILSVFSFGLMYEMSVKGRLIYSLFYDVFTMCSKCCCRIHCK